jgi:serine/threonine protein kinase
VLVTEYLGCKLSDFGTSRAKEIHDLTMTMVGTPSFAAPEMMRGQGHYSETVDVYSFGMLLVNVALKTRVLEFVKRRWEQDTEERNVPMKKPFEAIWNGSWHPLANNQGRSIHGAPSSIQVLAARCCSFNPAERPSFQEIMKELTGPASNEVANSEVPFVRGPLLVDEHASVKSAPLHDEEVVDVGEHERRKSAHLIQASGFSVNSNVRNIAASRNSHTTGISSMRSDAFGSLALDYSIGTRRASDEMSDTDEFRAGNARDSYMDM